MENLQQATEKICQLKGSVLALECLITALALTLPPEQRPRVADQLHTTLEACRTMLLGSVVSEHVLQQFEHDARRLSSSLT